MDAIENVLARLAWMREERIWPNGMRYLWTDAFGVVLLVSLYRRTGEQRWLDDAQWVVSEVERVLGRARGIRIGEAADRDGQYFHYLAMWLFALARLGAVDEHYRQRGIALARAIHRPFVRPGRGVIWKMNEDLSGPYPGYGLGALDAFDGYVAYRMLSESELADEIAEMKTLIDAQFRDLTITQDLGIGMMLWMSHFFPDEEWSRIQRARCLATIDPDVDRSAGRVLPRAASAGRLLRLHELRRVGGAAIGRCDAGARRAAQCLPRNVPVRR